MTADVDAILARRGDNGADFWASPDGKVYVGNPFSTIGALLLLHELDVPREHDAVSGAIDLVLAACRPDGRIRVGPTSPMYPCYTAEAARALARYGVLEEPGLRPTVEHLLETGHEGGGWRCSFSRFGKGPETRCANPGATLYALDALRFAPELRAGHAVLDEAVDFLLRHWETREPMGPCHWGIGTAFMRLEYPFLRYNLFMYVYVLSFYARARDDPRFRDARSHLERKLDAGGAVVVEHAHRSLKGLDFCAKGRPSRPATRRWLEIGDNLG